MVVRSLVLRCEIQEQLLHVPVEQRIKVGLEKGNVRKEELLGLGKLYLEIKCEEAQVVLLFTRGVVRDILDDHLDCVDVGVDLVLVEEGGEETEKCETRQY